MAVTRSQTKAQRQAANRVSTPPPKKQILRITHKAFTLKQAQKNANKTPSRRMSVTAMLNMSPSPPSSCVSVAPTAKMISPPAMRTTVTPAAVMVPSLPPPPRKSISPKIKREELSDTTSPTPIQKNISTKSISPKIKQERLSDTFSPPRTPLIHQIPLSTPSAPTKSARSSARSASSDYDVSPYNLPPPRFSPSPKFSTEIAPFDAGIQAVQLLNQSKPIQPSIENIHLIYPTKTEDSQIHSDIYYRRASSSIPPPPPFSPLEETPPPPPSYTPPPQVPEAHTLPAQSSLPSPSTTQPKSSRSSHSKPGPNYSTSQTLQAKDSTSRKRPHSSAFDDDQYKNYRDPVQSPARKRRRIMHVCDSTYTYSSDENESL